MKGVPMRAKFCARDCPGKIRDSRGFTIIELLIVMFISVVAAAVAIPSYTTMTRYLRIAGDARDLNSTIAQAKMRAAQDFTHARVHANLTANTFQLEVWDKIAGCWKTDGDGVNRCTATDTPVQRLSQGVSFGFGSAGAGNPNPQTTIAQAPGCSTGVAGGATGSIIVSTACIEFNSRGIPVASTNSPTANDALYVTDAQVVYGITVIQTGLIQSWSTGASSTAWQPR